MSTTTKIETINTPDPICPHCLMAYTDGLDIDEREFEHFAVVKCQFCKEQFEVEVINLPRYTTRKIVRE